MRPEMQIVPAIDIQQGEVVRAVAGERLAYLPLQSKLAKSADPEEIGRALAEKCGLSLAYLADLDAIKGDQPNWDLYRRLIACGLVLWIDAGLVSTKDCAEMARFAAEYPEVQGIIVGMESVSDREAFLQFRKIVDPDLLIFSLDLKDGRPLTKDPNWQQQIAIEIATDIAQQGIKRMIVIDLARIGMHGGSGTRRLCVQIHQEFPDLALYAGGGVRSLDDLHAIEHWGCQAALISSSLHDGWITKQEIEAFGSSDATA